ncbi:MAG: aminotransferase class IV [Rhodospirillaceae bacterium]|nr:aminotransferase class IV [Rhodospirillaceae bacterium]
MQICLNGEIVSAAAARIDPADRGFTLGDGVFETVRVRGGQGRRVNAHLQRLHHGLATLSLATAWRDEQLSDWIVATAAANALTDAAVRLTISRGPAPRGLALPASPTPTLVITAGPVPEPEPVNVVIAATTRRNEHSPLARIKSLNYLDNVLAKHEAVMRGGDDALMLNSVGAVACASAANLFALIDGGLVTPRLADGALAGVVRADAIKLGRAEEREIRPELLARASEVFLTNALGIRPVLSIDTKPVGDGEPGLITQLLAARL